MVYYSTNTPRHTTPEDAMNLTNTTAATTTLRRTDAAVAPRPRLGFERRERGFGVGYGNSSGYASGKRYTPKSGPARFRFT